MTVYSDPSYRSECCREGLHGRLCKEDLVGVEHLPHLPFLVFAPWKSGAMAEAPAVQDSGTGRYKVHGLSSLLNLT